MSPSAGTQPTVQDLQAQIDGLRKLVGLRLLGSDPSATMANSDNIPLLPTQVATSDVQLTGVTWTNNSPIAGSVAWTALQIVNAGNVYTVAAGNTANKFIWWTVGSATFTTGATYTPAVGIYLIATNTAGVVDESWQKVGLNSITDATINSLTANKITAGTIDASVINVTNINANNITSGSINAAVIGVTNLNASNITSGTLAAGRIAAASIDVTKLNIRQIIVVSLTLSNNTPTPGAVTLSSSTIYYNGLSYAVTGGTTTSMYIWWNVGDAFLTAGAVYIPVPTRFLIATNSAGTADVAWNKVSAGGVNAQQLNIGDFHNIPGIIMDQIVWTENSPVATDLAWSAGFLTYQGVSYPITAGNTTISSPWIYWQLSNPNVFQVSTAPSGLPALGTDGYIIAYNNVGAYIPLLQVKDRAGASSIIASTFQINYNAAGHPAFVIQQAGAGGNGFFRFTDGSGAGSFRSDGTKIQGDGNTGQIIAYQYTGKGADDNLTFDLATSYGTAGSLVGYLTIRVGGGQYKIPYYNL